LRHVRRSALRSCRPRADHALDIGFHQHLEHRFGDAA
jgi:hypothetical protein